MKIFCNGVGRKTVPPRNLQNANRDFLPRLCRSGLSCTDRRGMLNALPLLYRSAITIHSGKNVRFVRFYPPPPRLLYEGERLVCGCGGRRCRQAARECSGVRLGRMPARLTLYHTLVLVCGRASHRVQFKMGAGLGRVSGQRHGLRARRPRSQGDVPKSGMHPLTGRISQITGEICLTIGGFDQVDGFCLT